MSHEQHALRERLAAALRGKRNPRPTLYHWMVLSALVDGEPLASDPISRINLARRMWTRADRVERTLRKLREWRLIDEQGQVLDPAGKAVAT